MRKLQPDTVLPGMSYAKLFTDGASKGNPGPASVGAVLLDEQGDIIAEVAEYIGIATNNVAEYQALIEGLKKAKELNISHVDWITDSELIARQWTGRYTVKAPNLIPLYQQAKRLAAEFEHFSATHTLREGNKRADELANLAIKQHNDSKIM